MNDTAFAVPAVLGAASAQPFGHPRAMRPRAAAVPVVALGHGTTVPTAAGVMPQGTSVPAAGYSCATTLPTAAPAFAGGTASTVQLIDQAQLAVARDGNPGLRSRRRPPDSGVH